MGNIQKASQVGVKVITYHWTVIPIRRNGHAPGRGGSTYEAFKLEPNWKELPVGKAGVVSSDDYWERITCVSPARHSRVQTARRAYGRSSLRSAGPAVWLSGG